MISRLMPALAVALLGTGLITGGVGLIKEGDLMRIGIFLTVAAMPLLITHALHVSQRTTADQLADADRAGYHRALDHVARGLLDQPTDPCPDPNAHSGHTPPRAGEGEVIELHLHYDERKAQ